MSITDPTMAEITMFGGNFAPRGWAFCDGQLLAISQYSALFSLLGTAYGGDGRTTFGLPDLRGRFPIQPGNGPGLPDYRQGQKGGNYQHTLGVAEMPSHNHSPVLHAEAAVGDTGNPTGRMLGIITGDTKIYADVDPADDVAMASESIKSNNVGGGQSFPIQNPYLGIYYIIALEGTYPSRS